MPVNGRTGSRLVSLAVALLGLTTVSSEVVASELWGKIHSTPAGQIVVAVSTELVTLDVTPETVVLINGKRAAAGDLQREDSVHVVAAAGSGRFPVVVAVSARRKGPAQGRFVPGTWREAAAEAELSATARVSCSQEIWPCCVI